MSELTDWLRQQATGPMSNNPQHVYTCNQLANAANELDRMTAIMDAAKCRRCDCLPCECGRYRYPSNTEFWKKHEAAEKAREP